VILNDERTGSGMMKAAHSVDILAFVDAQEIPFHYFEKFYYLAPAPGGEKAYALLRETLRHAGKVGIACVVIQMRRHLAALVPHGNALALNILRCSSEIQALKPSYSLLEELEEATMDSSELSSLNGMQINTENDTYLPAAEASLDSSEPDDFDGRLMDRLLGRPHRRPAQNVSRHGHLRNAKGRRRRT